MRAAMVITSLVMAWGCADDAGERVLELETPLLEGIQPGEDIMLCTYLDRYVDADADIISFVGDQSSFAHHAILFEARAAMPVGTHPCNEGDMVNARHLATIGGEAEAAAFDLPEGVAFRMHEGHQLMVQSHWVNSSDQVITGRARFQVTVRDPSPERSPAALFLVITTDIDIPPGGGSARAECAIPRDLDLFAFAGHAHEHGTQVTIHLNDEMLYDQPWSTHDVFAPPIVQHEAGRPLSIHPGDRVTVDCSYRNDTDGPLQFPKEMCAMLGFYFPGDQ